MPDRWAAGWQAVVPAMQVALGLVLLVFALGKLRDPSALVTGALRYQILSPTIVRPAATLLPFAELALAVALLLGIAARLTGLATAALFIAFTFAVAVNLYRGRTIPCHCFSASATDRIGPLSLVRLLFLLALALLVASAHNARGAIALFSLSGEERWSFLCLALALLGLVLAIGPLQLLLREVVSVRTAAHWRTPQPTRGASVVSDPPLILSAAVVPARRDPRDASGSFHD